MAYYVFKPIGVSKLGAPPIGSTSAVGGDSPTPDNCHTLILLNTSTTDAVLFGFGVAGPTLVEGVTGSRIPAGSAVSLAIGTIAARGNMSLGTGDIVATSLGAGNITIDITYVCQSGSI